MKICLTSPLNISSSLGGTKNRIEFAEALIHNGASVTVIGRDEILNRSDTSLVTLDEFNLEFHKYLRNKCSNYDVVLCEAITLPFVRNTLPQNPLFVSRPMLLEGHKHLFEFREENSYFERCKQTVKKFLKWEKKSISYSTKSILKLQYDSLLCSDLVQVQNLWDADLVRAMGIRDKRIIVVPNGLSGKRLIEMQKNSTNCQKNSPHKLATIGTFDPRKGCYDIVALMINLWKDFPELTIKLIGAKGMFTSKNKILNLFPKEFHSKVEIILEFENSQINTILHDVTIGIYTSYYESFGFGALELISANIPIIAYKSPGPESFVPQSALIERGNILEFEKLVREHLNDNSFYKLQQNSCFNVVKNFAWNDIASNALKCYEEELIKK